MSIYTEINNLRKDSNWLMQICSLPNFSASRLNRHEQEELVKKLAKLTLVDDKLTFEYYNDIFKAHNLIAPKWSDNISEELLPVIALIPNIGMRILIEKIPDGTWKCDSVEGIKYYGDFVLGTKFSPIRTQRKEIKKTTAFEMFKTIAMRQKKIIIYAAIATISINALALGTSFFSMQVYDRVIPTHGMTTLVALAVGVFIAILLEAIIKVARSSILDHASIAMDKSYSHNIFNTFLKLRLDGIPQSVGNLAGQLQSYASIRSFVSSAAIYFIVDFPFVIFFALIILLLGGWIMALIPLIFLILSIITALFFKNKIEVLTKASVAASNKKLGLLVETVESAENVKATGASYSVLNKWNALTEDAIDDDIAIRHYSELAGYIASFLQQVSYVALVAAGAYMVSSGESTLTMGGLIAASILAGRVLGPVAQLPNMFVQYGRAKITVGDLDNIYKLPRDNEGMSKPLMPADIEPMYGCSGVKFSYGENTNSINISNLNINKGERAALLGVIGSGKSTMLKMLAGLYAPQEGTVLLGGMDIQQIARDKVSQTIGYLPQNTKLISGTLRDNLLMGMVGIDDQMIIDAANKTGLSGLINILPKGLDTPVPEGGSSVSGGQKQLIAITRMVLAAPKIWLLDEPTANMDDATERHILQVLNSSISADQTLILVTHKPALLGIIGRVIVVTPQGIAMDGPRDAVLKKLSENSTNKQVQKG